MTEYKQRTLLIVDDEPEIREILSEFLKPLGAKIYQAETGKAALSLLQTSAVDAIISDIAMPEMTGLELLCSIRVNHQDIPVVMLTAFGDRENILEALRLGALDFIEKPFSQDQVLDVANRALEIGIRLQRITSLIHPNAAPEQDAEKLFNIQHNKKMIGLFAVKNNQENKKKRA